MFRRFRWFVGFNSRSLSQKRLPNVNQQSIKPPPAQTQSSPTPAGSSPVALDAVHEIAVYIDRFHNLDLFQQGWYQIKITIRWEDSDDTAAGIPARVVQYEAPELGPEDTYGVWKIDDTENSFSTQPFRIKYARQDVYLSIMVAFSLSSRKFEGAFTSAVILKFELMYAPVLENSSGLLSSLDPCSVAVHEYRIPPKALLGLHSYCPVHFDAFHAVLVDISVHVSLLKATSSTTPQKADLITCKAMGQMASVDSEQVMLIKALINAHDILLEDLHRISKAINQTVELTKFASELDDLKLISFVDGEVLPQLSGMRQNGFEVFDFYIAVKYFSSLMICIVNQKYSSPFELILFYFLSQDDLLNLLHMLGSQTIYLWNTFLMFHRVNKRKIMDFLRETWANDRKAEWSIWMVYSKVELPAHFKNGRVHESFYHGNHGKALSSHKFTISEDPAQTAAMRAELHRRSIAQMKINNRSLQDLYIFGDPSRIPIVIVERVISPTFRTINQNSSLSHLGQTDKTGSLIGHSTANTKMASGVGSHQPGRVLKIVVFVHGFQGHHLDLRLVRNQWLLIDPKIEFLMSEVNEDKTYGDFREMGHRLAEEVIFFIKKKMDKVSRRCNLKDIKLNFVGHSIGNIIIRTALTESMMEPYLRYLHTYVSISGPHLGYLYSSNSLFNSGLWLLKKLKGTQCIHQLTFSDDADLQNTFIYNLCKHRTLENFRNIILLSSPQDGYVPYHSARIEISHASLWDNSRKGKVFLEMLNNCLDQIHCPSSDQRVFMRFDINFDTSSHGRNLNSLIGRAAHIEFLESDIFARFIMWSFPELFR